MFNKKTILAVCALAIATGITACGGEDPIDDDNEGGNDTPGNINPDRPGSEIGSAVLSPEESKEFLEESARGFISKFHTSDQSEIIGLSSFFCDRYGDLELPRNFGVEDDEVSYYSPAILMKAASTLAKSAQVSSLSRAVETYVYSLKFDQFAGVYEPGSNRWMYVDSSDDIVFRFSGSYGEPCELRISASRNNTSNIEYTYVDYDEHWDYNSNEWVEEVNYKDIYKIAVPKKANVTITKSGTSLADVTLNTDINPNGHKFSANLSGTVANIGVNAETSGTDSKISESATLTIDGGKLIITSAEINGKNLCNFEKIKNDTEAEGDDYFRPSDYLTKGSASVDVMGNVQAYLNVDFNDKLVMTDTYFDSYDYDSKSQALALAKQSAELFNRYITSKVCYNNHQTTQAKLQFAPVLSEYYSYWEYAIEGLILFPDNTTYSAEDYFNTGFAGIVNQCEDLYEAYEALWWRARY